jgi:subtilisin family serine protease
MRLKRSVAAIGIACALVAPVAATRGVAAAPARPVNLDSTQKLHPLLQYGAAVEPSTVVRVIVQKTTQAASASNIAASVQGEVVEAFNLIPAFVMDVAQGRLPTLATSPKVRYISPDGLVQVIPSVGASPAAPGPNPPKPKPPSESANPVSWANLATTYPFDTGATQAWSGQIGRIETGAGTTVAVVDSGIDANHPDFVRRVVAVNVNRRARQGPADGYGHGTHVAGIIGGRDPSGQYLGMAPNTLLVSVKVADDVGNATESDVLRGLDWVE